LIRKENTSQGFGGQAIKSYESLGICSTTLEPIRPQGYLSPINTAVEQIFFDFIIKIDGEENSLINYETYLCNQRIQP